ncbi:MAG: GNAT family N-acetyltransferase [Sphingobacteriaceae bacterium]|nr:GNAT family N-acetyltransferase [Sphingobacteriaceae bacterium]
MNFILKPYKELTVDELYEALKLRSAIFVIEQNCNYQDMDDKDQGSYHLLGYDEGKLVAYARILPKGLSYKEASIGRVVVDKNFRGRSAGKELMKRAIADAMELFSTNEIVISAQCYLERFYSDLGFKIEGESYLEDDIPHIKMRLLV